MRENNQVVQKSKAFAIRIIRLYQHLTTEKKEHILSKQILRSGTSIGANYAESQSAISKKDFTAKVYIASKECSESLYWLELLSRTGTITKAQFSSIYNDCLELKKLLVSITKTARESDI